MKEPTGQCNSVQTSGPEYTQTHTRSNTPSDREHPSTHPQPYATEGFVNGPLLLPWHWNPCFPKPLWTEDRDVKKNISNRTWTHTHTHQHTAAAATVGPCVSVSPAAFLHQTSSFRDEGRVDAVNAEQQRLLCGCIPPTGLAVLSHCGKLGEWRIAVFLTMTETLRCLDTVSAE